MLNAHRNLNKLHLLTSGPYHVLPIASKRLWSTNLELAEPGLGELDWCHVGQALELEQLFNGFTSITTAESGMSGMSGIFGTLGTLCTLCF